MSVIKDVIAASESESSESHVANDMVVSAVRVPDAALLLLGDYYRVGDDLVIENADGQRFVIEHYFSSPCPAALQADNGAVLPPEIVQSLLVRLEPVQVAGPATTQASAVRGDVIGKVTVAIGDVEVTRGDGAKVVLHKGDVIHLGDVLRSGGNGFLKLELIDGTVFQIGKNSRVVLDAYSYDPANSHGNFETTVLEGFFRYISGKISEIQEGKHTTIRTPTATIGIRGSELEGAVEGCSDDTGCRTTIIHTAGILDIADVNGLGMVTLLHPGKATVVTLGSAPSAIFDASPGLIDHIRDGLSFGGAHGSDKGDDKGSWSDTGDKPTLDASASAEDLLAFIQAGGDPAQVAVILAQLAPAAGMDANATVADSRDGFVVFTDAAEQTSSAGDDAGLGPLDTVATTPLIDPSSQASTTITYFDPGAGGSTDVSAPAADQIGATTDPWLPPPVIPNVPPLGANPGTLPVLAMDFITGSEGSALSLDPMLLLSNDLSTTGGILRVIDVYGATNGSVGLVGGNINYTPSPGFFGSDSFSYTAQDQSGNTNIGTVDVLVDPSGATVRWSGGETSTSTSWQQTQNWTSINGGANAAPDSNDNVFIPLTAYSPVLNADITVNDLKLESGAEINSNGFTITATGDVIAGTTIIGAGSLVMVGTQATFSGTVPNLVIGGAVVLSNTATATGDVVLANGSSLQTNGQRLDVAGSLYLDGAPSLAGSGTVAVAETIVLRGAGTVLDLTALPDTLLTGASIIDMTDPGSSQLVVSATDIAAFGGDLRILGDAGDQLIAQGAWRIGANVIIDGSQYTEYLQGSVRILVDQDVGQSGISQAPIANADAYAVAESGQLTTSAVNGLLANDSDANGDPLVTSILTAPLQGALTVNPDGSFTYDPSADFRHLGAGETATESFTYGIADGNGGFGTAEVTLTILGSNDAPVAQADAYSASSSVPIQIDLLANDSDPDISDVLSVTAVNTDATMGVVTNNGDGTFSYNAGAAFQSLAAGQMATDSFSYTVADGQGGSATATVTITVTGVNDVPVALGETFAATAGAVLQTGSVLANDSDPDTSDLLSVAAVDTSATLGVVTNNGDGTFSYDPGTAFQSLAEGQLATDSFVYTVSDGQGGMATATVTITVTGVNDAPAAQADNVTTVQDTAVTVPLLVNDSDPDMGDVLAVVDVGEAANGSIVIAAGGASVTYTPNAGFSGTDAFTYTIGDGHGGLSTATVTVTVESPVVNQAPVAVNDAASVSVGSSVNIAALVNDIDPDAGDTLSITAVNTVSTLGAVTNNGDGTFTYNPGESFQSLAEGQTATDSFVYTVSDGHGGTATATVAITVTGVNDAPAALADAASVVVGSAVNIAVLVNDSDPDAGDTLSVLGLNTAGTQGVVIDNVDGTFSYNPGAAFQSLAAGQTATDSFSYSLSDAHGGTATAVVTITVTGVNDMPVAQADAVTTAQDAAVVVAVLANDTDVDNGDALMVAGVSQGANGSVTIDASGASVTYTPNAGFSGTDTFTYSIGDGHGGMSTATVTVVVAPASGALWLGQTENWYDPVNWSTGAVPTAADDVIISATSPVAPVLYLQNPEFQTLTIQNGASVTAYSSSFPAGTIVNQGELLCSEVNVSVALNNSGLVLVEGSNNFYGTFINESGGALRIVSGGASSYAYATFTAGFVNAGLIELGNEASYATDASLIVESGVLVNQGTILVSEGLNGGGRYIHGSLENQGILTVDDDLTVYNYYYGTGVFSSVSGTLDIAAGQTLTIQSGTVNLDGATLSGTGTLSLQGATVNLVADLTLAAGGTVVEFGNGVTINGPGTLHNQTALTLGNDTVSAVMSNSGTLTTHSTIFTAGVQNSGTLSVGSAANFIGAFENLNGATLRIAANDGYGYAQAVFAVGFVNAGLIELGSNASIAADAWLYVESGVLVNQGAMHILADSSGGNSYLYGSLENQGILTVDDDLTVYNYYYGTGVFSSVSGTLDIAAGQTLTIQSGTVNLDGATLSGTGTLSLQGATVNLVADLTLAAGGTVVEFGYGVTINGPGTLHNQTALTLDNDTVNADVSNSGVLMIDGYAIFNGAFDNASGATLHVIASDAYGYSQATFATGFVNNGTIGLSNNSSYAYGVGLYFISGVLVNQGSIQILPDNSGGSYYLQGALENRGVLDIQHDFTVHGDFAQSATGILNITLGGTAAADVDVFTVTGTATLAGTANLILANGYVPALGDQIVIAEGAAIVGSFDVINGLDLGGGLSFGVQVVNGQLVLTATDGTLMHAPVAADDAASVTAGSSVSIDVLTNDSDADAGDVLMVAGVSQGAHGGVMIYPGGTSVIYTPAAGFAGTDTFTYTVEDGNGGQSMATVTVVVTPLSGMLWLGYSESWYDPANWSTGAAPAPVDGVIISATAAVAPVLYSQNTEVQTLAIQNGASLTAFAGSNLAAEAIVNSGELGVVGSVVNGIVTNSGLIRIEEYSSFNAVLINTVAGTLRIDSGGVSGYADSTFSGGLVNHGLIELGSDASHESVASLAVYSGPWINLGTITVVASNSGGERYIHNGVSFDNQGILNIDQGVQISNAFSEFTSVSGTVDIAAGQTLVLGGGTVNLDGATLSGTGMLMLSGAVVNLVADLAQTTGGVQLEFTGCTILGPGQLHNQATLMLTNGYVAVDVINTGVLSVEGSTRFYEAFDNAGGATFSVVVSDAYALAQAVFANGFVNYGLIELGNNSSYAAEAILTVTSGVLVNQGSIHILPDSAGGIFYMQGALENQGVLDIQHDFTVYGDYVQSAAGILNITLGGTSTADVDVFTVTGTATLAGTANIILANGYVPALGDQIVIAEGAAIIGSFDVINGLDLGGGLSFGVQVVNGQLVLTATHAPIATDDAASVTVGSSVSIDVLANDSDPDVADTLAIDSFTQGALGSVALDATGTSLVYSANSGAQGTDSFTYWLADSNGALSSATVTVTVGSAGPVPLVTVVSLSSLDGSNGFVIPGRTDVMSQLRTFSASAVGDVNGDGFEDILVGTVGMTTYSVASSIGYVVLGSAATGAGGVQFLAGANVVQLATIGDSISPQMEISGAYLGDVNGDGLDDMLLVNPVENAAGYYGYTYGQTGIGFVLYGYSGVMGGSILLDDLAGNYGFEIVRDETLARLGDELNSAGDFNGDGYADMVIVAGGTFDHSIDIYNNQFYTNVSDAVYLVFGGAPPPGVSGPAIDPFVDVTMLDGASSGIEFTRNSSIAPPTQPGEYIMRTGLGQSVAVGDINGDGLSDLAISGQVWLRGFYNGYQGERYGNETFVVFGSESPLPSTFALETLDGTNGFMITNEMISDASQGFRGWPNVAVVDFNGDGFDDVVTAAWDGWDVMFGRASGFGATIDAATLDGSNGLHIAVDTTVNYWLGEASNAGDFNGDGYDDLMLLLPGASGNVYGAGSSQAYILFGGSALTAATLQLEAIDATQGVRIDADSSQSMWTYSSGSAGDINGDGYDDIVLTTYDFSYYNFLPENHVVFGGDFSGTVDYQGTAANDTLTGDAGDNILIGGLGNDVLAGSGGNDVLIGAAGNDILVFDIADILRVDGGGGLDTLRFDGANQSLDLSLDAYRPSSIERFDLTGIGDNSLALSVEDVLDVSDGDFGELLRGSPFGGATVIVAGNAGDTVNASGQGWSSIGLESIAAITYSHYVNGTAHLLVDSDVTANVS